MSGMITAAVATVVGVGISAASAYSEGKASTEQAGAQADLSQLEIDNANEALGKLGPAKANKEKVAKEEYKFGLEGLSSQTGIAKEDLNKQMVESVRKSGLAGSGTIEGKKSDMWKRIQGSFQRGQEGLMGQLGKSMGGVEEWFEGEKARLKGVIKKASLQKSNFETQEGGWYLGKNIAEFFSDRKLKKDIKYMGTLDSNINVYEYEYIWGGPRRMGVMADEVEKLIPEAVTTHPNGYKSVNYNLIF